MGQGTIGHAIGSIFLAIVGVAIVAVIVSKNAATAQVIQAFTSGFGQDLSVAVSPVTGGSGASLFNNSGFNGLISNGLLNGA